MPLSEPIISVSGLRGIVGESLTPEVAIRYAAAFAAGLGSGPIVVTRDGRTSGAMLADLVRGALRAAGRNVLDGGIASTPTLGVLVREHSAAGGVQISASHNPSPYNGMKLFSRQGKVLTAFEGQPVLERYQASSGQWAAFDRLGSESQIADTLSEHLRLVLATVNVAAIRQQRFRVLLDSNHGAGSLLGARLLSELGCTAVLMGEAADGNFAHAPEPVADNLAGVAAAVPKAGAVVGFCQDPDADRLALIDERGRYLGEEYTLALCVNHVLAQQAGPIVINGSTSRMSEDIAAKYGVSCFRSAVGEANVVELMQAKKAVFGGEGNGGPIDPRVGYVRDSFVGMALVLDALAQRGIPSSALADELPRYEIVKTKATLAREQLPASLAALAKHFSTAQTETGDGLRLAWPNKWLQVRGSNTEPIVRIIAEAKSAAEADGLCAAAREIVAKATS